MSCKIYGIIDYFCITNKIYDRKYTPEIIKLSSYFPVVGIIGARQVGKTTIVKMLTHKLSKPLHYLDLESPSDYHKLQNPELYLSALKDKCVVIDEIQTMPELFPVLRSLIDKNNGESCQFIITGSATPDLFLQSTETLAGRIAYVDIYPFSMDELPGFITTEHLWFWGGFPKALFAPDDLLAAKWIENFIKTYIERDLRLLGLSAEPLFLRRFWTMLAHLSGNIVNYSTLSSSLGIAVNTVKRYIDFFEHAFLIHRLFSFSSNIKKRLVKSPKLFISDTGILHNLLGIKSLDELYGHPSLGNSWEAYCINQILGAAKGKYTASFFRTHDGSECDLVLSKGNVPCYAIEIKFSDAPKLTHGNLLAFSAIKAKKNYIIVMKDERYPIKNNNEVVGIKNFIDELINQN